MTEKGFWQLLEKAWQKGRMPMHAECRVGAGGVPQQMADYLSSHSLLPADNGSIPEDAITPMGRLLFDSKVGKKTKEAILILLAHREEHNSLFFLRQYVRRPDKGLDIFAGMALDEREHAGESVRIAGM